jgi:hypothetical protein
VFSVHIPFKCNPLWDVTLVDDTINFGFNLRDNNANDEYFYQLQLLFCRSTEPIHGWATFSKRTQINVGGDNTGVVVFLKINNGAFDFRKLSQRQAQIIVNLFHNGSLVKRGCSSVFQVLPKKRKSSAYKGGNK